MEIFNKPTINPDLAIALGFFDGLHLGHKKIIETLKSQAQKRNLKTAVITFSKNPANYFKNNAAPYIQTNLQKRKILKEFGIDYLYELDFSFFKELEADEYIEQILIKNFSPKVIVAGFNHTFGKNRKGSSDLLNELSKKYDYNCIIVPEEKFENQKVSSTNIRDEIKKGNLEKTAKFLNRPLTVAGRVIKGKQIARKLGYPTANIIWEKELIHLPYGVYLGFTVVDNEKYKSLISWGKKPTFESETNKEEEILEAHILNFNKDIYDRTIEVGFISKIREQKKFENVDCLKKQLDEDFRQISFFNV